MLPSIVAQARADRAFLGRAIGYLAGEAGIRQFPDIGTGLPTADNTHEVAQRVAPARARRGVLLSLAARPYVHLGRPARRGGRVLRRRAQAVTARDVTRGPGIRAGAAIGGGPYRVTGMPSRPGRCMVLPYK